MGKPAADPLALYDQLVATMPQVERKGKSLPYTSRNGHMFSFLAEGRLALRLPPDDRAAFVKKYKSSPVTQHGVVLEEYVAVPDKLLRNTAALAPYFAASYDYVGGLKPKATTRKAAKKTPKKR